MPSIPLLFTINTSEVNSGVVLNDKKNQATFPLETPLRLTELKNPRLSLLSFNCFFTSPNVFATDSITFEKSTDTGATWSELCPDLVFSEGLYSVDGMSLAISRHVEEQTLVDEFKDMSILLGANFNTDKCTMEVILVDPNDFPVCQVRIKVNSANLTKILGFSELTIDSPGVTNAPNQAFFNSLNSIVLTTDLLNNSNSPSVFNRRTGTKFLASINIDSAPGYQIQYTPNFKTEYSLNNQVEFSSITVTVLDQDLKDITMNNVWSVFLTIDYDN